MQYIDQKGLTFNRIINVAGVDIQKPFVEYTEEKLLFQLRVNVEATVSLTHALLKRRAEKIEVLTVSSMSGVSPMPYFAVYSATKALLINLFTSLHYELKKEGVKVTVVMPGGIPTRPDIIEQIKEQGLWGKLSAKSPEFVAEKSLKAVSKNKIEYIPGFFNKFLNFIMKLAPKRIVLAFIAKRWKSQTKDAF
jgi:short-subunit dehydrogenase